MPRKQNGEGSSNHWSRSSSDNRKPPLNIWRPAVPRWEKMFCSSVGSIAWERIVETKKYMCLYDNVVNWDDSAGKEAFENAKSRFWADINGLPCNIPWPDPDMYIDNIDWNSSVDHELLLALESDTTFPSHEEKDKGVVIFGDALVMDQSFSCGGWGEPEEDTPKPAELVSGAHVNLPENNNVSLREQYSAPYYAAKESEWQNYGNDSWGWNQRQHGRNLNRRKSYGNCKKE